MLIWLDDPCNWMTFIQFPVWPIQFSVVFFWLQLVLLVTARMKAVIVLLAVMDRLDQENHPVRLVDRTPTQEESTTPPNLPSAVRYKKTDWINIKDDWLISWTETVVEPEYSFNLRIAHTMMATAILDLKNAVVLWTPPFATKKPISGVKIWQHYNSENYVIVVAVWVSP